MLHLLCCSRSIYSSSAHAVLARSTACVRASKPFHVYSACGGAGTVLLTVRAAFVGPAGSTCQPSTNSQPSTCKCANSLLTLCGNTCVNMTSDNNNCGKCGAACATGRVAAAYRLSCVCVMYSRQPGLALQRCSCAHSSCVPTFCCASSAKQPCFFLSSIEYSSSVWAECVMFGHCCWCRNFLPIREVSGGYHWQHWEYQHMSRWTPDVRRDLCQPAVRYVKLRQLWPCRGVPQCCRHMPRRSAYHGRLQCWVSHHSLRQDGAGCRRLGTAAAVQRVRNKVCWARLWLSLLQLVAFLCLALSS
jgi:hypothetical protein